VQEPGTSDRAPLGSLLLPLHRVPDDVWFTHDSDVWRVFEMDAATTNGEPDPPRLVFDEPMGVRILRRYPADWRELSTKELVALSWTG
jgi:hypothetical protein